MSNLLVLILLVIAFFAGHFNGRYIERRNTRMLRDGMGEEI